MRADDMHLEIIDIMAAELAEVKGLPYYYAYEWVTNNLRYMGEEYEKIKKEISA